MSYRFVNVKRYKRGATWADGETRTCTMCRIEKGREEHGRRRANQAIVVADMRYAGSKFVVPVGYCKEHEPKGLSNGIDKSN